MIKANKFFIIYGLVMWFIFMFISFNIQTIAYGNTPLTIISVLFMLMSLGYFTLSIELTIEYIDKKM